MFSKLSPKTGSDAGGDVADTERKADSSSDGKLDTVDKAMAAVVERARRLKMTSLKTYDSSAQWFGTSGNQSPPPHASSSDVSGVGSTSSGDSTSFRSYNNGRYGGKRAGGLTGRSQRNGVGGSSSSGGGSNPNGCNITSRRPKRNDGSMVTQHHRTPRGVQCLTAHLPVPPPPPPPSPRCPEARELCLALEKAEGLMSEFQKTDELVNDLISQAEALKNDLEMQARLQRDMQLLRDLETEAGGRSMLYLIQALREDSNSEDVQAIRQRCMRSLSRSEQRFNYFRELERNMVHDDDTETETEDAEEVDSAEDTEYVEYSEITIVGAQDRDKSVSEKSDDTDPDGKDKDDADFLENMGSVGTQTVPRSSKLSSESVSSASSSDCSIQTSRHALYHHMVHYMDNDDAAGEPAGLGLKMEMDMDMEPPELQPEAAISLDGILTEGSGDGQQVAHGSHRVSDV